MTRDELLTELAYYTQVLHEATEHETELDNRHHHLGHLAMAARMFKILHLRQPVSALEQIYRIESKAYSFVKLPGPSATSALEAWQRLSPSLRAFIDKGVVAE
jgi:hypothetical protein